MYKDRFNTVLDYCQTKKIKVVFYDGDQDICYPSTSLVCIRKSQNWKNRLFGLLHEIGHIQIFRNKENWAKDFSLYSCENTDGRVQRSKKFQVSLIAEEIDAWRIGRQIAEDLGIFFDPDEYKATMNECVFTYISSANNKVNS